MTTPNTSSYANLLQIVYANDRLENRLHAMSPVFKRIKQSKTFTGKSYGYDMRYGGNEAVGATIADCQAAIAGSEAIQINLTRKTLLATARIDRELLDVAKQGRGAFVSAVTDETEQTELAFLRRLASQVFQNGGGAIGRIKTGTTVNTDTITLENPQQAQMFHRNMIIEADNTDGSSGGAVHVGSQTITSVDYQAGTVTGSLHWDDVIAGIAADDYLFPKGQFGLGWAGFAAYCPASNPGPADNFYGANRSVNPTKLAGVRKTASGGTMEDSFIDAATEAASLGMRIKHMIINPYRLGIAVREGVGKKSFISESNTMALGASKMTLAVPTTQGLIEIISDPFCQRDIVWLGDLGDWEILCSPAGCPHFQRDVTEAIWFPVSNDNAVELRMAAYANMKLRAGDNIMRVTYPA
jgi:hypothetical protein